MSVKGVYRPASHHSIFTGVVHAQVVHNVAKPFETWAKLEFKASFEKLNITDCHIQPKTLSISTTIITASIWPLKM